MQSKAERIEDELGAATVRVLTARGAYLGGLRAMGDKGHTARGLADLARELADAEASRAELEAALDAADAGGA